MFNSSIKVNPKQKRILYQAMVRNMHRQALDGRDSDFIFRRLKDHLWTNLAEQLNMYGPKKNLVQWKKCWTDLRAAMIKKYKKAKKHKDMRPFLTFNERRVIRACGLDFSGDEESDEAEVIEDGKKKHQQPAPSPDPIRFETVNIPSKESIGNEELMRGTIKIEDEVLSESESLFLSEELNSEFSSQSTPRSDFQDEAISEIRKMHRNLLRESRRQTALMRELVKRLPR